MRLSAALLLAFALLPTAAGAVDVVDEFDAPAIDPGIWNACQVDAQNLSMASEAADSGPRRFLRATIVEKRLNQETCTRAGLDGLLASRALAPAVAEEEADTEVTDGSDLGPALGRPAGRIDLADTCPTGGEYQRSELRFQKRPDLVHDLTDPHWYGLRFRVGGDVARCGSARWIVAQWKEPNGDSPFLGLRLDNGVLHVTVQSDHCRCVVAKASGDPDMISMRSLGSVGTRPLQTTAPLACVQTDLPEGAPTTACTPAGMTVLTPGGLPPTDLPNPTGHWVDMGFHVKAGSKGNGRVDIYADGAFVARVDGQIGYSWARPGTVKFKFGHYRSWVPGRSTLDMDRLCVSKDAARCLPGVDVLP